jgi:hypothetical protein
LPINNKLKIVWKIFNFKKTRRVSVYLKRLVLIAGILFIVSSGELRAMDAEGQDSEQEEDVEGRRSASPKSTSSVVSTASDSSARLIGIIAPLTAAVESLSAQITSLLDPSSELATGCGRGSSGAGVSNGEPAVLQQVSYCGLGQSSLDSRWSVSPSAKTAADGEGAFNAEELNFMTQLAVLNSKLDKVVALIGKPKLTPVCFGGVTGHPFGALKPEAKIPVAEDVVDDVSAGTVVYRQKPVVVGGVKGHPFGSIRSADACNGSSGTISRVQSVSPISFGAVIDN